MYEESAIVRFVLASYPFLPMFFLFVGNALIIYILVWHWQAMKSFNVQVQRAITSLIRRKIFHFTFSCLWY